MQRRFVASCSGVSTRKYKYKIWSVLRVKHGDVAGLFNAQWCQKCQDAHTQTMWIGGTHAGLSFLFCSNQAVWEDIEASLGPDPTLGLWCQEIGLWLFIFLSIAVFTEVKDTEFSTWETVPTEIRGLLNKKTFQFFIALLKRCGELGLMLTWLVANDFLVGGPPHVDLQTVYFS